MTLEPFQTAIGKTQAQKIRLIASDVDGTLTQQGKFTPKLISAIETLTQAGIELILITGRSAGWVQALNNYLPVSGAIAENGGLFYSSKNDSPELLVSLSEISQHRQQLAEVFNSLKSQFPHLKESTDNRFRLTDWTFDVEGLSSSQLQILAEICHEKDWGFTYSTVQCHIKLKSQDKATGLLKVLSQYFPKLSTENILTVGDSPNDESLFNPDKFPHSVGVANILHYTEYLNYKPAYVTTTEEVNGFCELAELLTKNTP
ncbi:MAG: HAD family hydrolase [Limnoraphis robusta]|uniref:HAD family hydrolase n=1 Tax=Limnoraphis robusta CS-951 TaxID=1637645 RepID=A0A0F5YDK8_9CYAN|nr:HAD family hydrolase [Limnoraphis robusta]KKD36320.1 HAD family hydrolase [Limnoraphis robusta CS-951]MEA5499244.1 HAD family hydrolase [Limnoraphis robusta BA-68 BA1]